MEKHEAITELMSHLEKGSESQRHLLRIIMLEYNHSFREYLLAYGPFKDVPWDNEETP